MRPPTPTPAPTLSLMSVAHPSSSHVIPQALGGQIAFFEARVERWMRARSPGVSGAQVEELASLVAETVRARVASEAAKETAKATTRTLHAARAAMLALGRAMVSAEKLDGVASAAAVIVETKPLLEVPARPTAVRIWVSGQGDVTMAWDAERAGPGSGIYFEVRRAVTEGEGSGPGSVRVFVTAETRYTDVADLTTNPSPPPLAGGVLAYQVRAVRGGASRTSEWTSLYTAGTRGVRLAA